jgi:4-aminobutyrate aminotransferase / (S)-3-amino-2-methylpropionate transaminase / 5-aminovalerate transaminase
VSSIKLVTEIPGPRSLELLARREAATPNGAAKLTPLAIVGGSGAVVTDADGNQLLDFAGGIGMLAVGHTPPSIVAAMQQQAAELVSAGNIVVSTEPAVEVAEALNRLTPGDHPKKTLLMNSGAEAVEAAVSIARAHTGRGGLIVFEGAYHGRTNLTLSMTSKYALFKKGFGPFAPEVYRLPFPNRYRRPDDMGEQAWVEWHCRNLRHALIAQIDPSALAAIVIEPVLGEGGFLPTPPPLLQTIREICDEHGVVMIADEIQSGFGRTGTLFAIEHAGVVPDLITSGKSLGAGMPIAAVTGRAEIMDAPHPGGLGGTYSGAPLAAVAAREAIRIISEPAFLERARAIGERLRSGLEKIQADHPGLVGDVRGLGPMLCLELVKDPVSKEPDMDATAAVCAAAVRRGLIAIRAGLYSNCVRLLPPLILTDDQIDEGLGVLAAAFDEVAAGRS